MVVLELTKWQKSETERKINSAILLELRLRFMSEGVSLKPPYLSRTRVQLIGPKWLQEVQIIRFLSLTGRNHEFVSSQVLHYHLNTVDKGFF